ncbi:MAG: hemoglobin [Bacteroidia bacterium]
MRRENLVFDLYNGATVQALPQYGEGDTTFQEAGGEAGVFRLVNTFFDLMRDREEYREIWDMHPEDKDVSRDKLARFLCAWTGGPRLYKEKYGSISIPAAHAHLKIDARLRDGWLSCMAEALDACDYPDAFKAYLLTQLGVPADRVRQVCARNF